jgi:two-component system sensor histidine kinase KdpD
MSVPRTSVNQAVRFIIVAALVCGITLICYRWLHVNLTTVGFSFLLAILVVSAVWGLRCAIFMAILSTLAYNYFFLPPVLHLTIADPQNWVALVAFLFTAVVASELSERARRQAVESNHRRRELERLYSFSQQLLVSENVFELFNAIPRYLVDAFGVTGAAMFLERKQEAYYFDVASQSLLSTDHLKSVMSRGEPILDREQHVCFMPLRMGVRTIGSIGLAACDLSRETLEAIGSLTATALERASTVEKLTKTEAARESDRLRSVLLDSVTHEFRTPLTAIKASAETLLSDVELDKPQRKDLLTVINEESDRLNRLIGEAAEVARLDSHQLEFHIEPHQIREAVDAATAASKAVLQNHPLQVTIPDNLPQVRIDVDRIKEVLTHLLDNAGKYSPAGTPIQVTAELRDGEIVTSVADHGPGIDAFEQEMIFEKFYRGRNQRMAVSGTGMGLAIARAILELHGGKIGVMSQVGRGSLFYFSLPVA